MVTTDTQRTMGVRFAKAGKIQYFDPGDDEFENNDYVVADTANGVEIGWVVIAPDQVVMAKFKGALSAIVRKASPDDLQTRDRLSQRADELIQEAKSIARELRLRMKLVQAIFSLDETLVVVTYTAEDRVDFRQLIRRLGRTTDAKVELREVGPRDEAKVVDGIGRCGRTLCCSTWLTEFSPVTMKMAKEQDLPLSPPGLAGQCGRLRCCLRYEYDQYREMKRGLPKIGATINTSQGEAVVVVGHPLKQTVTVRLEEGGWTEISMAEIEKAAETPPPPPRPEKAPGPERAPRPPRRHRPRR